ncbi:unnamed protein product [Victoria cruziana]
MEVPQSLHSLQKQGKSAIDAVVAEDQHLQALQLCQRRGNLAGYVVAAQIQLIRLRKSAELRWQQPGELVLAEVEDDELGEVADGRRDLPLEAVAAEVDLLKLGQGTYGLGDGPRKVGAGDDQPAESGEVSDARGEGSDDGGIVFEDEFLKLGAERPEVRRKGNGRRVGEAAVDEELGEERKAGEGRVEGSVERVTRWVVGVVGDVAEAELDDAEGDAERLADDAMWAGGAEVVGVVGAPVDVGIEGGKNGVKGVALLRVQYEVRRRKADRDREEEEEQEEKQGSRRRRHRLSVLSTWVSTSSSSKYSLARERWWWI